MRNLLVIFFWFYLLFYLDSVFSPAFWNNLENKYNISPTRLTFLLLIPIEDVRPDLKIKRKYDEWCVCCIYSFILWENLSDFLLARTCLIANWRFPAWSLGFVFLETQHFIGFRSSQTGWKSPNETRECSLMALPVIFLLFVLLHPPHPLLLGSRWLCGTGFILSLSGGSSPWCTSDKQSKGYLNYRRCCLRRFTFYFHTPPSNSPRRLNVRPLLPPDCGVRKKYELLLQMSWSEWSCVIRAINNTTF